MRMLLRQIFWTVFALLKGQLHIYILTLALEGHNIFFNAYSRRLECYFEQPLPITVE